MYFIKLKMYDNYDRHDFVNLNMKLCFDKKLLFDLMFKFNIFFMSI